MLASVNACARMAPSCPNIWGQCRSSTLFDRCNARASNFKFPGLEANVSSSSDASGPMKGHFDIFQRRHDRLYLHGPHPRKTMVLNHGLQPLRTMVKIPTLAPGYGKEYRSGCRGGFQDHGSEGLQTMVPDHGFTRVGSLGTMQVQAIMPPLNFSR